MPGSYWSYWYTLANSCCSFRVSSFFLIRPASPSWVMLGLNSSYQPDNSRGGWWAFKGSTWCQAGRDSSNAPCMRKYQLLIGSSVLPLQLWHFRGNHRARFTRGIPQDALILISGFQVFSARESECNRSVLDGNVHVFGDLESNYQALYLPVTHASFHCRKSEPN